MNSLKDKLLKIKELLEKSMSNSGIGGKGAVKAGFALPGLKPLTTPKPSNTSKAGKVGIPQLASQSKTSPIKSAEQIHNKSLKDKKMKEAQASMKSIEMIKYDDGGQWSLSKNDEDEVEKSGYKGYTLEDNAKRKAKNIGETTGIHTMDSIKRYGGSGPSAAAKEAKEMKAKSKKMPVKEYSKEEIAEMNKEEAERPFYDYNKDKGLSRHLDDAKRHVANKDIKNARKSLNWAKEAVSSLSPKEDMTVTDITKKTEGRTTTIPGVSEMGIEVRRSDPKSKAYSKVVSPEQHTQTAKEIAKENIKQTTKIKPKLPK